jgi:hypothetical protein
MIRQLQNSSRDLARQLAKEKGGIGYPPGIPEETGTPLFGLSFGYGRKASSVKLTGYCQPLIADFNTVKIVFSKLYGSV